VDNPAKVAGLQQMAQLWPLESPEHPLVGGFLVRFPSGHTQSIVWPATAPLHDTLQAAKETAARLLDGLLKGGLIDDAERTNWASMTASIQALIVRWANKRRAHIGAAQPVSPQLLGADGAPLKQQ
jgi:hypothetical protein